MRTRIALPLTMIVLLAGAALAAPEVPVDVSEAQIAEIVAAAPLVPVDLGLGLNLTLVDYIDCTRGDDPHPMLDQGTSSVVKGPAGTYRTTSQGRHTFFAYRWRAAAKDKPHVLVIEYPDDAQRSICFFTHESPLSGRANIDWSLETGVYTGNPLPITNRMQYHTMFFWPTDAWPAVIVGNWIRAGAPAAASRIWVFRVEGDRLPALDVADPDPTDPRIVGDLYNWALVPVRGAFGLTNQASTFDHIAEYYAYLGCNVVSWPVVSNNTWGFRCLIPAWDGGDKPKQDWLAPILAACEHHNVKFIGTFEMGRGFTIDGKEPTAENREAYREGLLKGFAEFIERYGDSPALQGIAFGTPDATLEQIMDAARSGNAHGFICRKPDGYDSRVGERGGQLSAGEKQRLAIARAILRNPRILILDEATSAVDSETEKQIQEALQRLVRDRTTFAIAHRLSTLRDADRLIVLEEGRIKEIGTHRELMDKEDGLFRRLVDIQQQTSAIIEVGS